MNLIDVVEQGDVRTPALKCNVEMPCTFARDTSTQTTRFTKAISATKKTR